MNYDEFINNILDTRGRFSCGDKYHERHHIIPKCCGGSNDNNNLIDLFPDEHYIAHKLLALENKDNEKLQYAWWQMCHCKKKERKYFVSEEEFKLAKEEQSKNVSIFFKNMWSDPNKRKKIMDSLSSEKTRNKMSESAKKRYNTESGKAHIKNMWNDERRKLISKIVIQMDKNGEYINEYCSAREASRCTDICYSSIAECCEGKRKTAGGYIWMYKS